ncbi:hypothetical protein CU098_001364, partial [Rhizopus stolonifer]
LLNYKAGTNATLTGCSLIGTLSIVSYDADDEKGTILLTDITTHTYFPCHVDRFYPKLDQAMVSIQQWNFICQDDLQWIEFRLVHVFPVANPTQSVLEECLFIDELAYQITQSRDTVFYSPQPHMGSVPNHVGMVASVSPLLTLPNTPAQFLVEVSHDHVSTYIMFEGDACIKYYPMFRIGCNYMFQRLNAMHLRHAHIKCTVLCFREGQSLCHTITPHQLDQIQCTDQIPLEEESYPLCLPTINQMSTFTGHITRVIDPLFGMYEFDHQLLLCLFHHVGYSPLRPLRVNTEIRLHHVHMATVQLNSDGTSHLLDTLWHVPRTHADLCHVRALVGCVKTQIDILSFPDHCDFVQTSVPFFEQTMDSELKQYVYMDCLRQQSDFSMLMRHLEIYAALVVKFKQDDIHACKKAYDALSTHPTHHLKHHFIWHHQSCPAVGKTTQPLHVVMGTYPSLGSIQAMLAARLQEHRVCLSGESNRFETGHVYTRVASDDLTPHVDMMNDGRLYLMEGETRLLLLAPRVHLKPGGIYLLKQMQLFEEDLSYLELSMTRQSLKQSYLVCEDVVLLGYDSPLVFQTSRTSVRPVAYYRLSKRLKQGPCFVLDVVNTFPIQTCFDAESCLYLEGRVVVRLYDIQGSSKGIPTQELKECIFILDSRHQSLKLHAMLQTGTQWVIHGLTLDASLPDTGTKRRMTFVLGPTHTLYPVLDKDTPDALQLEPVYQDSSVASSEMIYSVSQLLELQQPTLTYQFFEHLIHVQGIVISKRMLDGFDNTSSHHAKQLYQDLGIGTGKPNRRLYLQLRQPDTLDVIDIYLDTHQIHYPLGLIVGAHVVFRNLVPNDVTSIQVLKTRPDPAVLGLQPTRIPTRLLHSFIDTDLGDAVEPEVSIVKILCHVVSVISLVFQWECSDCGSMVRHQDCYRMCQDAHRVFVATAFVQISD